MKPVLYFTVSRKELRPSEMPPDMPLLLSAASFWSQRKDGSTYLSPPKIQPNMFPIRGADCGGFVATVRWGAHYRYQPAQYIRWLSLWKPQWAASFDVCCFIPQLTNNRLRLVYPGPNEIQARQQYTTEMAEHLWIHARSFPWAWCPTVHGYFPHEYEKHARQLAPLIRQMYTWYSDPATQQEDDEVSAFRVGVGSLAGRARLPFMLDILDRIQHVLGKDIPLHLWGVKLQTLKAGIELPGVVSLDTGAWNGLFGHEHEKRRESGLTEVEYSWRVSQPRYEQRVQHALQAPHQLPFSFLPDGSPWNYVRGIAPRIANAIAQEDEEHDLFLQDVFSQPERFSSSKSSLAGYTSNHYKRRRSPMHGLQFFLTQLSGEQCWTPWIPLQDSWKQLSSAPGLYRIRIHCLDSWLYLGQTTNLRNRIQMLKGVFGDNMPYAAPHVAGPALYAYRHIHPQATLEVSVYTLDVPERIRLALECFAIALHRQQHQRSPLCQFGRMPRGWRGSSGNSFALVERGKRFRGGPTNEEDDSHLPDIAPNAVLTREVPHAPDAPDWFSFSWSPWLPAAAALFQCDNTAEGLYRIRSEATGMPIVFLGQGKLKDRLADYKKQAVSCSWVAGAWHPHQRLALVVDLIASHLLTTGELPREQFLKTVTTQTPILSTLTSLLLA